MVKFAKFNFQELYHRKVETIQYQMKINLFRAFRKVIKTSCGTIARSLTFAVTVF